MIFHKVHERIVNGEDFKIFFREFKAVCTEKGIDSPVFIMDNTRIHHYRGLMEDNELSQYTLKYLPSYSPFLNPIENVFSVWKN
ncbi:hypothetical protein HERIO_871 [Hepatospora eriocheir]|uniref:Tc1-like transposase DDE domain-containing protein n=1 Tax=Hepatospora eriocheir TaxID=1081669 RepID=A0A1X0QBV7_9MICR|nr:hypothetical protein HERIO_871 [Hepatospora eriocheir]